MGLEDDPPQRRSPGGHVYGSEVYVGEWPLELHLCFEKPRHLPDVTGASAALAPQADGIEGPAAESNDDAHDV